MNTRTITIAAIVLLILVAGAAYAFTRPTTPPTVSTPAPTNDAATGTNTTTTPPPATGTTTATSTPEKESKTAALNQRIYQFGVHITPLEVVSDSRCPMGVYCIQAGEVVIKAKLEDGTRSEIVTMHQGSPISFGTKHVTLMDVTPPKSQSKTIAPSDYRFTFSVAYGMGGDAP